MNVLNPAAKNRRIADLRMGLSYVGVKLDNGQSGIAAVLPDTTPRSCTVLKEAGTYAGSAAVDVLQYLVDGGNALHRAIGLATANALVAFPDDKTEDREATTYFNLKPGEKVAMVGLFAPLVGRIRATGAILTIIEKNPDRLEILSPDDKRQALKECDVAIVTATTLLNNTFEETISLLGLAARGCRHGPVHTACAGHLLRYSRHTPGWRSGCRFRSGITNYFRRRRNAGAPSLSAFCESYDLQMIVPTCFPASALVIFPFSRPLMI